MSGPALDGELSSLLGGAAPQQFHPYQLIRLLEAHYERQGYPRLGESEPDLTKGRPALRERIRLRPSVALSFPPADVESLTQISTASSDSTRCCVTVTFAGLYGASSPLPGWYCQEILWTERPYAERYARNRERRDTPASSATRAFLDIFNHRMLSLRFRAWRRNHHEYEFKSGARDTLSRILLGLCGLAPDTPRELTGIEPARLLKYLGLFLVRSRSALALECLLAAELRSWLPSERRLSVAVQSCPPPRWVAIPPDQRSLLGRAQAGMGAILGQSQRDRSTYVIINIVAVSYRTLLMLTPGATFHRSLVALARLYLSVPLDLQIRVFVPHDQIPPCRLGESARMRSAVPSFLGRKPRRTADPLGGERVQSSEFISFIFHVEA